MSTREHEIPVDQARALVAAPGWHRSFGMFPGEHWRHRDGQGCIHVRVDGDRAWVHRDAWDPGQARRVVEHMVEAAFEIPSAIRAWLSRNGTNGPSRRTSS